MASEIHMPGPECLIENTNGRLLVNPKALKILSAIRQPVVVVAIVGLYRTGKSYLMNKLAGKKKGFSLGSTVQSHTKGIWMWCVPHPKRPNRTLVLLDTEGLGDVEKFFPKKKCFIFDRPTHRKKLNQLEELCDDELDSEFVQQAAVFCSYIFSNSKTKTLSGGIKVDGPRLETLVQTYVDAINSGDLPCMENAVLALAEIENSAAVKKAIAHYDQQMGEKLQLPTETLQELLDLHRATEKEAIEVFMKSSFKDIDQLFQKDLAAEEILQEYLKSKESVTDAILQTDQTLSEKEKLIEVERVKAESAQAAAKMLEEMQIKNQQMMEQKEKSYQEHVKQLTEKMERDRAQLLEEQERTLALKLQEQSRLLQEGFQEENKRLQNEIQNLQKKMEKPRH
ncbi:hypothetical protein Celaphus_00002353, partial [Cervus elaphus hippelaphus]